MSTITERLYVRINNRRGQVNIQMEYKIISWLIKMWCSYPTPSWNGNKLYHTAEQLKLSPVQLFPFPVNPVLQEQRWDPTKFWQLAMTSQTESEALHSPTSKRQHNRRHRPFLNIILPLFQNESWCVLFHMKMRFYLHVIVLQIHLTYVWKVVHQENRSELINTYLTGERTVGVNCDHLLLPVQVFPFPVNPALQVQR